MNAEIRNKHDTMIHMSCCSSTFRYFSRYQSQWDNRFTERRKVSICGAGVNRVVGDDRHHARSEDLFRWTSVTPCHSNAT